MSSIDRHDSTEGLPRDPDPPGAREIVEDLADRIAELRQDGVPEEPVDPAHARALLAAQTEIARVRPESWASIGDRDDEEWLRGVVGKQGAPLAGAVNGGWSRGDWQAAAERLEACYEAEELPDPVERAALARELLEELDEVELAALAAERITAKPSTLSDDAAQAAAWVAKHPDTFLAAGTFVRAAGEALRPDLVEHDPDLALTAEKFVRILEVLREAEAVVTLANVQPIGEATVSLVERLKKWWEGVARDVRETLSWRPEWPVLEPVVAHGASADEPEGSRVDLAWRGGGWQGTMRLPPPGAARGGSVTLWVRPWPEGVQTAVVGGVPAGAERVPDGAKFVLPAEDVHRGWGSSVLPVAVLLFSDGRIEAAQVARDSHPGPESDEK